MAPRGGGRQAGRRTSRARARGGAARGGRAELTGDEIILVLPADEDFRRVAHLVLGGLAARLDLTFEHLEDLQLALDGVLGLRDDDGDVTVAIRVADGELHARVGPFEPAAVDEFERSSRELGLRRVLETVCDSYEVAERDGEQWFELVKRTAEPAGAAG